MRGDKVPTRLLLPPNEISSARNELYLTIKLLAMETHKQLRLLPRLLTDSKAPLQNSLSMEK